MMQIFAFHSKVYWRWIWQRQCLYSWLVLNISTHYDQMRQIKQPTVTMKLIAGGKTCRACADKKMRLHIRQQIQINHAGVYYVFFLCFSCHLCMCIPDAMKACGDAKGTANGATEYYLPHPYKCNKYIECYSSGDQGAERDCPGSSFFNPQYKDSNHLFVPNLTHTQCKQT